MTTVWNFALPSDLDTLRALIYLVLGCGVAGAVFGSMAGLVQWLLLRSRSTAAFPGRMILISTVAGAAGAMPLPLVFFGVLRVLIQAVKFLPPLVSIALAILSSLATAGAVYGAIMATASTALPTSTPGSGSSSSFMGSTLRLPRGW